MGAWASVISVVAGPYETGGVNLRGRIRAQYEIEVDVDPVLSTIPK